VFGADANGGEKWVITEGGRFSQKNNLPLSVHLRDVQRTNEAVKEMADGERAENARAVDSLQADLGALAAGVDVTVKDFIDLRVPPIPEE
jgi:hypothetical protein